VKSAHRESVSKTAESSGASRPARGKVPLSRSRSKIERAPLLDWYPSERVKRDLGTICRQVSQEHQEIMFLGSSKAPLLTLIDEKSVEEMPDEISISVDKAKADWSAVTSAALFFGHVFVIFVSKTPLAVLRRHNENRHGAILRYSREDKMGRRGDHDLSEVGALKARCERLLAKNKELVEENRRLRKRTRSDKKEIDYLEEFRELEEEKHQQEIEKYKNRREADLNARLKAESHLRELEQPLRWSEAASDKEAEYRIEKLINAVERHKKHNEELRKDNEQLRKEREELSAKLLQRPRAGFRIKEPTPEERALRMEALSKRAPVAHDNITADAREDR